MISGDGVITGVAVKQNGRSSTAFDDNDVLLLFGSPGWRVRCFGRRRKVFLGRNILDGLAVGFGGS